LKFDGVSWVVVIGLAFVSNGPTAFGVMPDTRGR
jgi:hypothetical protein